MNDLNIKTSASYSYIEAEKMPGTFYTKHYDEIITTLHFQAREEYEHCTQNLQNEKYDKRNKKDCLINNRGIAYF